MTSIFRLPSNLMTFTRATTLLLALVLFGAGLPEVVRDDLAAGRFWHAARTLREAGAAEGTPEERLLLARAEAGWHNHPGVIDLLEGAAWLDEVGGGEAWYLLGSAYEGTGRWSEAAEAYRRALASPEPPPSPSVVAVRLARAAAAAGDGFNDVLQGLDGIGASDRWLVGWAALALGRNAARAGDTAAVRMALDRIVEPVARRAARALMAEALVAAGDSAAAAEAYLRAAEGALADRPEGDGEEWARLAEEARAQAGLILHGLGAHADAEPLLWEALAAVRGPLSGRVAGALLDGGLRGSSGEPVYSVDAARLTELGRVLDRVGDGRRALRAYDAAAAGGPDALPEWARLARARLMGTVRGRQPEALEEHRAIRASTEDDRIGARNLKIWRDLRRRQGRDAEVAVLERWLLEEHPGSPEAAVLLWNRGFSAEGRGDRASALATYRRLIELGGRHVRAGQARMRSGQIHLAEGRTREAALSFDAYLEAFPEGGRWEEAAYWSARTHLTLGDSARALERLARIRRESPVSYYAVLSAELLEEPFSVDLPPGSARTFPGWLREGLRRLDALEAARLDEGAEAEVRRLIAGARGEASVTLTLAEELNRRGRTVAGINLGWDLRRAGMPYDQRLVRVVFPFPYEDMVRREAEEWGVDPIMLAAIIRQESAFKADIVSHAGAVGLMQVMPPTGAQLARAHGPENFSRNHLETPEVNLHLGAAFFAEMSRRYDGVLPLVLAAYNAGPTRATRWKRYPEVDDLERFTERIPFDETRGYVKNVRRNLGLYRVLYAADETP